MPHISVNKVNYFYHEAGHGLPVVLLAGFPLNHQIWKNQVHDLASVCRVITPDFRGFGHSHDATPFTMQSLAEDIYVLLSNIRALPCVIGGLSMGGYVALAYERHYASTLRGLILMDTRAGADTAEGKLGRDAMIELARNGGSSAVAEKMIPKMIAPGTAQSRPDLVAALKTIMENTPAKTTEHAQAAMRDRHDFTHTLGRIVAPTLIICGDADAITPPSFSEEMHKAIKGSSLSIITGAGHMSPMEQPQQVSRAMRQFLKILGT
jgi:pimeloyl-ACP methyl ester carboxylesterase